MGLIVVVLLLALLLSAAVMLYAAFPYRGQDTPLSPLLGQAMRAGVQSLPTLDRDQQERSGAPVTMDLESVVAGADSHR